MTIPIVFTSGGDPVEDGFVTSLNRPGGNITGISWFGVQLSGKAMGLLLELVPSASVIALLLNPQNPQSRVSQQYAQEAARTFGRQLLVFKAGTPSEINTTFAVLRERRVGALLVGADPFYAGRRQQIVAQAARDAIPVMYANREFVADGGLASYGNDPLDAYRRAGVYAGRILNGASPSDLPIEQATKFQFVINLKTAKALGLTVPPTLLASADEVIE
jgi:putative ABC transport system substrate-binding protein